MNKSPTPVIIDSDIGDDITDTTAVILALKSPELEIKAFLSNNNYEYERAKILAKLVRVADKDIPVFAGVEGGDGALRGQREFVHNYSGPVESFADNVEYIEDLLEGGALYLSDGTLTNPAYLKKQIPSAIDQIEFHVMAGAIEKDYEGRNEPVSEWNIDCDREAAREFFQPSTAAEVYLYPLDCSWNLEINREQMNRMTAVDLPLNRALDEQYSAWRAAHEREVVEYDSLLMAAVMEPELITRWEEMKLTVDAAGQTVQAPEGKRVQVALQAARDRFVEFFLARMCKPA